MTDYPLLRQLENDFPKELIYSWHYIEINADCRLYYKRVNSDKDSGFHFHSVKFSSCPYSDDIESDLDHPECKVETLLHGTAYFDGLRHLYFGTENSKNDGYFYYPDLNELVDVIDELKKLEKKFCQYSN